MILVSGGAGFIGSAVIRELMLTEGREIVNVDKLTYAGNLDSLGDLSAMRGYRFVNADLGDFRALVEVFEVCKPQLVMHLAAETHVDRSIDDPGVFIDTNIKGTFNLLEAARLYFEALSDPEKIQFRFHHISTDEVYGDLSVGKGLFTEQTSYAPSSPYSASKAASDHLVRAWGRTYGLPIIISNCKA